MNPHRRGTAALVALLLALAACGDGSSPPPTVTVDSPTTSTESLPPTVTATPTEPLADPRVTLAAYSQDRAASVPEVVAPEVALRAALALALPQLQPTSSTMDGPVLYASTGIVLPALQAARIDVLRAAAAGDTLAEVTAALPAEASGDVTRALLDGVSRHLWAPASALFNRSFLASIDTGGSAVEPWRATEVVDWPAGVTGLAGFGSVTDLKLSADTRLVIGQRFEANAPANGHAVEFEGVGVRSPNRWYTAPMVALEGPGGTLRSDDYVATATWVGDHLWVSLRPPGDQPLYYGLPPATLNAALLAVWSAYPAPEGMTSQSAQVWPRVTMTLENRSRLPAGIVLPYDKVHANLSGLDGGGTFLTETIREGSLAIDTAGLRAAGAQAMAFTFSPDNLYGLGSVSTNVTADWWMPDCPRAVADWRGAYLALIDRAGRLLLVASLPDAGDAATNCRRI